MKIILFKDYEVTRGNPFNKASIITYDGAAALTNGHLMFTQPEELPVSWKYEPLSISKEWLEKPKPAFPECNHPTAPMVITGGKGTGFDRAKPRL